MTQLLAMPDFARGQGFLTDAREVDRSIGNIAKRLIPCSTTLSKDHPEVRFGMKTSHVYICGTVLPASSLKSE